MVVELRFFYTIIFPTLSPQIRRYQQETCTSIVGRGCKTQIQVGGNLNKNGTCSTAALLLAFLYPCRSAKNIIFIK